MRAQILAITVPHFCRPYDCYNYSGSCKGSHLVIFGSRDPSESKTCIACVSILRGAPTWIMACQSSGRLFFGGLIDLIRILSHTGVHVDTPEEQKSWLAEARRWPTGWIPRSIQALGPPVLAHLLVRSQGLASEKHTNHGSNCVCPPPLRARTRGGAPL